MTLLFYEDVSEVDCPMDSILLSEKIIAFIESQYANLVVFGSYEQFKKRLSSSHHDITGALVIITQEDELDRFVRDKELLEDVPLFLILPNADKEIKSLGHQLHPRYVTFKTSALSEVKQVLTQFIKKVRRNNSAALTDHQTDSYGGLSG